jgi:hypothetical protein
MYKDTHLFSTYDRRTSERIIPIATFDAKNIVALKKSFSTSNDADEKSEILATLIFHQSALLLLTMSFLTEETELIDLVKEIFRNH